MRCQGVPYTPYRMLQLVFRGMNRPGRRFMVGSGLNPSRANQIDPHMSGKADTQGVGECRNAPFRCRVTLSVSAWDINARVEAIFITEAPGVK